MTGLFNRELSALHGLRMPKQWPFFTQNYKICQLCRFAYVPADVILESLNNRKRGLPKKKTNQLSEAAFQLNGKMSLKQAIPLGLQHVLAMFVGNLTPLLIITSACGIAAGEFAELQLHLLQNAMLVAGVVTLVQLFSIGPVGGNVPIVMGTSSGFLGVFNSVAATMGGGVIAYGAIMGASIIGGLFEGVLPNTSFSQNVGLVAMTKVVNRFAISTGAIFLILCGLCPKLGALVSIMPQAVLGGAAVMMFSSIVISGIQLITKEPLTGRNLSIVAVALGVGYGMGANTKILSFAPEAVKLIFGGSGIVPAAMVAILLNILLPREKAEAKTEEKAKEQA